jgi:NAD(P)-dependent dehydrogenase (short-subunit alcohol dehydrogenase family)
MPDEKPVVLITGASTGFGRLIAETLARHDYRVAATMRNLAGKNAARAAELRELAARESLWLRVHELDVTDDASVARAVEAVVAETGRIDVLVNNAGYGVMGLAEAFTTEQARRILDTNFLGVVRMNRAVAPLMRRRHSGLIIHISSGAGRIVLPGMGLYCASKWALEAIAETYRYELASLGVDSVIIEPGAYATPVFDNIERPADPARQQEYGAAGSIAERVFAALSSTVANPQEIADAVLQTIETPFGQRKLRQRIGGGATGVEAINEVSERTQAKLLDLFGLGPLTTPAPGREVIR